MRHSDPMRGRRKVLMRLARLDSCVDVEPSHRCTDDHGNREE